jgi:hypothetical protein
VEGEEGARGGMGRIEWLLSGGIRVNSGLVGGEAGRVDWCIVGKGLI